MNKHAVFKSLQNCAVEPDALTKSA